MIAIMGNVKVSVLIEKSLKYRWNMAPNIIIYQFEELTHFFIRQQTNDQITFKDIKCTSMYIFQSGSRFIVLVSSKT